MEKSNYAPAGFFSRFFAYLIGSLILFVPVTLFLFIISKSLNLTSFFQGVVYFLLFLVFYFILRLFYTVFFTYYFGGTLGKLLTGLRVRKSTGEKLDLKTVIFRQLVSYNFSLILFGLGFFSILKDPKKQAWHDKAVDSNVFKTQSFPILGIVSFIFLVIVNGYYINGAIINFTKSPVEAQLISAFKSSSKSSTNNLNSGTISPTILNDENNVINLIKNQQYNDALGLANKMLAESTNVNEKTLSFETIAYIYLVEGDLTDARNYYSQAANLNPNIASIYTQLARIDFKENNAQQALVDAQKAVSLDPNNPDAYFVLGIAYFGVGIKDQAIQSLQQALKLSPNNPQYTKVLNQILNSNFQ